MFYFALHYFALLYFSFALLYLIIVISPINGNGFIVPFTALMMPMMQKASGANKMRLASEDMPRKKAMRPNITDKMPLKIPTATLKANDPINSTVP